MYNPVKFSGSQDFKTVTDWIYTELVAISQSFFDLDRIQLVTQSVAPGKPRTGLTMLADGTNWNPGAGAGVYTYYAGAWHKLG